MPDEVFNYMRDISANSNDLVKGNEIYNHVMGTGDSYNLNNSGIRILCSSDRAIENNNIQVSFRGVYAYGTSADILAQGDNTFKDNAQAIVFKDENTGDIEAGVTYTDSNVIT